MMAFLTLLAGVAMVAIGIGFYSGDSITSLIPAFIGLPILICGALAFNPDFRKWAVHIAIVIAVLAVIAVSMRMPKAFDAGGSILASHILSLLAMLAYIALCVRSFIKARQADNTPTDTAPAAK